SRWRGSEGAPGSCGLGPTPFDPPHPTQRRTPKTHVRIVANPIRRHDAQVGRRREAAALPRRAHSEPPPAGPLQKGNKINRLMVIRARGMAFLKGFALWRHKERPA